MKLLGVERFPGTGNGAVGRVSYEVRRGGGRFVVIADFFEDGSCHFADAEGDEPRWHPYQPTHEEIEGARRLLAGKDEFPRQSPCRSAPDPS
jgi:hypothetical protein